MLVGPRQGGGCLAAPSPIPWVGFVLSYQAGVGHLPDSGGRPSSDSFTSHPSHFILLVPCAAYFGTSLPSRCGQGVGPATRLVLHSTPQSASVRSHRPFLHSLCGIGFIFFTTPLVLSLLRVCIYLFMLPDFLVGRPFLTASGAGNRPPLSLTFVAATTLTLRKCLIYAHTLIVTRYAFPHAWSYISVTQKVFSLTYSLGVTVPCRPVGGRLSFALGFRRIGEPAITDFN